MLLCTVFLAGCGSSDESTPRYKVSGSVDLDGKPLNHARIVFVPQGQEQSVVATGSVIDGKFSLSGEYGPSMGSAKVEIYPETMDMDEYHAAMLKSPKKKVNPNLVTIPLKYNSQSELKVVVDEDVTKNNFDFHLTSK